MVLQKWDPFLELRRIHGRLYRPWLGFTPAMNDTDQRKWSIPLDIVQEEDRYVVRASLPGIAPENIEVSVDHDVLTIKGRTEADADADADAEEQREVGNYMVRERRSGYFIRSLHLPDTVNVDEAKPNFDNGVLTITLPKVESRNAKHLTVTVGKAPKSGKE